MDRDGLVDDWNAKAEEIFGWSRREVLGRPLVELIVPPAYREAHEQGFARFRRTGRGSVIGRTVEITARRRDGSELPIELTIWDSEGSDGRQRFNALVRDITARAATQEQLARRAFYDDLTGLPNRALFLDRLGHALSQRPNRDEVTAVFVLDLDDFKTVNDSLGHAAGDALLVEVSRRLSGSVRPADTLARLAGDEFAMLLHGLAGPDEVAALATRLLDRLVPPFDIQGRATYARASLGIAISEAGAAEDVDDLLRDADLAMYAAKAEGAGGFAFFEPAMHATASRRLELKADLQRAIGRGEIVVHYQPIVSLTDLAITGVEALARWQHPTRGLVPPNEFVPLAEETGLVRALDGLVMREGARQAAAWRRQRPELAGLRVNVNISARDLADESLLDEVAEILASTGLPPANLMLEVTESALAQDVVIAGERLRELKALGVRIALDDFGTGYSSLSYLQAFPLDTIKVDRSFVSRLDTAESAMAELVVDIGHRLCLDVIAEGVETPAQLDRLRELGCGRAQGYLFSRPLPPEDFGDGPRLSAEVSGLRTT